MKNASLVTLQCLATLIVAVTFGVVFGAVYLAIAAIKQIENGFNDLP